MSWLNEFVAEWIATSGLKEKQDIQAVSNRLPLKPFVNGQPVLLGDDTAAIPSQEGYLLLAAEGVWPPLLRANPRLAGRSCVLANVSDIYAMGGRPTAIVDVLFASDDEIASEVLAGMQENAERFGVPIVGGHFTKNRDTTALAVAILGHAKKLLTSHTARPGDQLLLVCKLEGNLRDGFDFWDCSSQCSPEELKTDLECLPFLAESGLCDTAKDVSMAGILGTTIMLLETSGYGAEIYLDEIPCPEGIRLEQWLKAFHSYGFILSARPEHVEDIVDVFKKKGICCIPYGQVKEDSAITVQGRGESKVIWDLKTPLMGFVHC